MSLMSNRGYVCHAPVPSFFWLFSLEAEDEGLFSLGAALDVTSLWNWWLFVLGTSFVAVCI